VFPNKFNGRFFNLCDECHWDFDGNCITHVDCFWEYSLLMGELSPLILSFRTDRYVVIPVL
jgi:hypothetical protein